MYIQRLPFSKNHAIKYYIPSMFFYSKGLLRESLMTYVEIQGRIRLRSCSLLFHRTRDQPADDSEGDLPRLLTSPDCQSHYQDDERVDKYKSGTDWHGSSTMDTTVYGCDSVASGEASTTGIQSDQVPRPQAFSM